MSRGVAEEEKDGRRRGGAGGRGRVGKCFTTFQISLSFSHLMRFRSH
jgi:hypothetical protein